MKFLESTELLALLKAAKARSNRDWAMLLLTYRHGMRASEVCGLKLSDVDLKTQTITFQRAKGSMKSMQPLDKLAGQPLMNERAALRLWLADRAERQDPSDSLFVSQKGGALKPNGFWRLFKSVCADAGINGRSCHSLKHTRASLMIQGGANLSDVRQQLGHVSLSSTLRYVHSTDEQAAKAARRAEANIF
jgi:site-specific recombinase XerD